MKTICVFGADGRTGKCVVSELLNRKKYNVIASVQDPMSKSVFDEAVTVCECDVLILDDVTKTLEGADMVISTLGHIKGSDPLMQTKGVKNIVTVMKEKGIRRILSLTGTGVRISNDTPSLIDRILNMLVVIIDAERISDGIEHSHVLKDSGLDWTILRVLKLTNKNYVGKEYKLTPHGPVEPLSPRKKVACILVDLLEDDESIKMMPVSS